MSKGTLYIFCGKMASGKSTLAKQLAENNSLILMSEDVLLSALYPGDITDVSGYVKLSQRLKSAMRPLLLELLQGGVSVVLDFSANTVKQRKWITEIVVQADAQYEFHYLDSSHTICKAQLTERAVKEPGRHATDTTDMFDAITRYFEPPSNEKGFEAAIHKRD